jgi:methionyl aminopeptidase
MTIKTPEEIEVMAEGGRRLGEVLRALVAATREGITTKKLDRMAYELIHKAGAKPAFLHYRPGGADKAYPYTLCASVNAVVVHGQPSDYALRDGDVLKLDLGLIYKGWYLDAARTVGVGTISPVAKKLIVTAEAAFRAGAEEAVAGKTTGDIGRAIEKIVSKNKFGTAEGLTGHGIGRELHEDPTIFNFGKPGRGDALDAGMVIAIEPMITAKSGATVQLHDDSWATRDSSLASHYENTVAITENGPRILTE